MSINIDTNHFFNQESLNLFKLFTNNNRYKKNCIFDVVSIIRSLYALSKGVYLQDEEKVHSVLKLFEESPKSTFARSGIFLRSNLEIEDSYKKTMQNNNFYVDYMPFNVNGIKRVNQNINALFPIWPGKNIHFLNDVLSSDIRLYIKDESIFSAEWREPFQSSQPENFYIGDDVNIKVPMMVRDNYIEYMLTFDTKDMKWVSMKYSRDKSMLIIMPNKARTYTELVDFCVNDLMAEDIYNFYHEYGKDRPYSSKKMPKFQFESKWDISNNTSNNDQIEIDYVSTLFKPNLDLRKMCQNLGPENTCDRLLQSTSSILNNEYGTFVFTKTEIYEVDGIIKKEHKLVIDKSFIFIILDKNKKICQIGIYAG